MATLGLRFGKRARFYIELPKPAALALLTLPLCAILWQHQKPRLLALARRLGVVRAPPTAAPAAAPAAADSSSDDDDYQEDPNEKRIWDRVQSVFESYALSPLAMAAARKWVRLAADPSNKELERLRGWLLLRMNGSERAPPPSPWQSGCPEIVGGLRASPIWDASAFDWLRPFEEHAAEIRAELLALKEQRGFQPLKLPNWASKHQKKAADGAGAVSHDAGDWNVFYLFLHEEEYEENCRRCPLTTSLLQAPRNSRAHNSRNSVRTSL